MTVQLYASTMVLLIDMSDSIDSVESKFQIDAYRSVFQSLSGLKEFNYEIIEYGHGYKYGLNQGSWSQAVDYFDSWSRTQNGTTCMYSPLKAVIDNFSNYRQPVIIDITGDGVHNCTTLTGGHSSEQVTMLLDQLELLGAQINVLYIGQTNGANTIQDDEAIFSQYKNMVRGGGFSLRAENFLEFEHALFEKMSLEMVYLNSNIIE
jgi:hypothetical protein